MGRREYSVDIEFNGMRFTKIVIDPHYEEKHFASINDGLIIQMVKKIDGLTVSPEDTKTPFSYFTGEFQINGKLYKMIWLCEDHQIYIGIVNAYRR